MGKTRKVKVKSVQRNLPLAQQLEEDAIVKPSTRVRKTDDEQPAEKFIEGRLSKKILLEARHQQDELEEELGLKDDVSKDLGAIISNLDIKEGEGIQDDVFVNVDDQEAYYKDLKVSEADEIALQLFMNPKQKDKKTLADYIMEKLKEKETEVNTQFSDIASVKMQDLDKEIVELYKGVKLVLSRYRSGKIPKAFKIIPALSNWEQILSITDPDNWTSAAMYQATRLFTANLKDKMAQRFFNLILLPRIRDEISEYKRLNVHLYQSLKKALFKPGAFYKGIVLPLCQDGDCTLREAVIISSILARTSIPLMHSCAAMLKIAEMEYSGANSIFLLTLLRKKYALPYRVIDAIVAHFLRFSTDKRDLPVLWYQALLAFVENYSKDISDEQKDALTDLCKIHRHHKITPVILSHIHQKMDE
ncbi:bystin [Tetranychus urticae]|uniref:Bystin n=1 Tax=Tetranychus urticae TaxID=32264 RepID=T1KL01_TETUR|nr:bystin [Tetranychus urticae]